MIYLQLTLLILAAIYIYCAYKAKQNHEAPVFDPRYKTWRRDLTPHETKIYNEMRRHWQKQAKITYKKINHANRTTTR